MKKSSTFWILKATSALLVASVATFYFWPEHKLPVDVRIDKLVVFKSKNIMHAYSSGEIIKTYRISVGSNTPGDKICEGDKRTPEGSYTINSKNPHSAYYKNLGISYPDKNDVEEARRNNVKPGGLIKIHGLKNGRSYIGKLHRLMNWTAGCIAVTNEEMEELYQHVPIGTPIIIKP